MFLAAAGATVAEASQLIGAQLVLGLFAAPAAAAARLSDQPWRGFWLVTIVAIAAIWVGVALAYPIPAAPASLTIMITAAGIYLIAAIVTGRERSNSQAVSAR